MTSEVIACHRFVHRYVGREFGGHRGVAASVELPRELETLVQRRSDLSGEDLGRPLPPYVCGYALEDGSYALARTHYLVDADCLGAVRTETVLLPAASVPRDHDPMLLAAGAFEEPRDLRGELRRFQEARAVERLEARALPVPPRRALGELLAPLVALGPALVERVLCAAVGPRAVALVGAPPAIGIDGKPVIDRAATAPRELLTALLALFPAGAAWQAGLCTLALSPRPWVGLQLVPLDAIDRYALRAAREGDVAIVDLARGESRNVAPSDLAAHLQALIEARAWDELDALRARAGQVPAYRTPADLGALLRYEALAASPRLAPEETVELMNHLRVRGASEREVVAPLRALLRDPPEGRLVWLVNVVASAWLGYRHAHPDDPETEAASELALLRRALAAQRFDLAASFLERMGPLDPAVRDAVEDEAVAIAAGDGPLEGAAGPALVALLVGACERASTPIGSPTAGAPAMGAATSGVAPGSQAVRAPRLAVAVAAALARRAPLAEAEALARLSPLVALASGPERTGGALALLDAAAAAGATALVRATIEQAIDAATQGAAWPDDDALRGLIERAAALGHDDLVVDALHRAPVAPGGPLVAGLRALRGRAGALALAADALAPRVVHEPAPGDARAFGLLVRAAALGRRAGRPDLRDLARAVGVARIRARSGEAALLERVRRKVEAGAWAAALVRLELATGGPAAPARVGPGGDPAETGAFAPLRSSSDAAAFDIPAPGFAPGATIEPRASARPLTRAAGARMTGARDVRTPTRVDDDEGVTPRPGDAQDDDEALTRAAGARMTGARDVRTPTRVDDDGVTLDPGAGDRTGVFTPPAPRTPGRADDDLPTRAPGARTTAARDARTPARVDDDGVTLDPGAGDRTGVFTPPAPRTPRVGDDGATSGDADRTGVFTPPALRTPRVGDDGATSGDADRTGVFTPPSPPTPRVDDDRAPGERPTARPGGQVDVRARGGLDDRSPTRPPSDAERTGIFVPPGAATRLPGGASSPLDDDRPTRGLGPRTTGGPFDDHPTGGDVPERAAVPGFDDDPPTGEHRVEPDMATRAPVEGHDDAGRRADRALSDPDGARATGARRVFTGDGEARPEQDGARPTGARRGLTGEPDQDGARATGARRVFTGDVVGPAAMAPGALGAWRDLLRATLAAHEGGPRAPERSGVARAIVAAAPLAAREGLSLAQLLQLLSLLPSGDEDLERRVAGAARAMVDAALAAPAMLGAAAGAPGATAATPGAAAAASAAAAGTPGAAASATPGAAAAATPGAAASATPGAAASATRGAAVAGTPGAAAATPGAAASATPGAAASATPGAATAASSGVSPLPRAATGGGGPVLASALVAAMVAASSGTNAARWVEVALALAQGHALEPAERGLLARSAAERLAAQALTPARPAFDVAVARASRELARALGAAAGPLGRAAVELALRALVPGRPAPDGALDLLARGLGELRSGATLGDAPLLVALARRVREGPLELEQVTALGPAVLDAVLGHVEGGFSLRLQNGLRRALLAAAEGKDPARDDVIAVGLARLRPHVAPDRPFRVEVAGALRKSLGSAARPELVKAIAAFEA